MGTGMGEGHMGRKGHSPEEIIGKLREAAVGLAKGQRAPRPAGR